MKWVRSVKILSRKTSLNNNRVRLWNKFKERVHLAVSNNIPTKMVYGNKPPPWINQKLKRQYKQKQRAYNAKKNNL